MHVPVLIARYLAVILQSSTYQQYQRAAYRNLLTVWSGCSLTIIILYLIYYMVRVRRRAAQSPGFGRDAALGVAFVLLTGFSGPIVVQVVKHDWQGAYWLLGLVLTGFLQWIYVWPAAMIAGRKGRPGLRNGMLAAATIALVLDLIGFSVMLFFVRAITHLQ